MEPTASRADTNEDDKESVLGFTSHPKDRLQGYPEIAGRSAACRTGVALPRISLPGWSSFAPMQDMRRWMNWPEPSGLISLLPPDWAMRSQSLRSE
ncbi:otospiralin-like isoform X2 [Acipenser ruthenus]|uniref:otospiralin-like isoform X2 n=1 Tax=Acipenser ruthenus TaxID=7906 RepID=UPI0027405FBD|nr:otospiralin-like isoform X2 [Acipenser ruthenus]